MTETTGRGAIGRRRIMQTGLGMAGSLALFRQAQAAKSYPALGTFPAGISGHDAFVGITTPLRAR